MPPPDGLVAATGRAARRGSIRAASVAARPESSSSSTGMSRNAGSVRYRSRSAMASLAASIPAWIQPGSVTPSGPNAAGGGGSSLARIASSSSATMPELFGGWVVTRTPR